MALVIEDGGFKIEQIEVGSEFWDFYGRKKVEHKDGTTSTEWKVLAYGLPIESCINKIILCRLNARHPEIMNLQSFFNAYKFERAKVISDFNLHTINLTKDLIKLQKEIKNEEK